MEKFSFCKYILSKRKPAFVLLFILCTLPVYSQLASSYFPSAAGYKWYYKSTPLDTLNNPQTSSIIYRVNSFDVIQSYQGYLANVVYSEKRNDINVPGEITDTTYYYFINSEGWRNMSYQKLDTLHAVQELGLQNFIRSLQKWYSTFRFNSTVNSSYNLFSKDTTVIYSGNSYPMRVKADCTRMIDETVSTINGIYSAKKFIINSNLSYLLTVPPLPTVPIKIVNITDTVWIASDIWIIKKSTPTEMIDLRNFGFNVRYLLPGEILTLTSPPSGIQNSGSGVPLELELKQNFPNPFNPSTSIYFDLPKNSFVTLSIYNSTGKEIEKIVNQNLQTGSYKVTFDGSKLSSGLYFYRLVSENNSITKKMLLIK